MNAGTSSFPSLQVFEVVRVDKQGTIINRSSEFSQLHLGKGRVLLKGYR